MAAAAGETLWWVEWKDWFWTESFWLPPNYTWADLGRNETVFYPDSNDLWMSLPLAFALFFLRLAWERFIAYPIGRHFKIRENSRGLPKPNSLLESAFRKHHKILPSHDVVVGLSKQLDWTPREIERWWRKKTRAGKPCKMQRFQEATWRFLFYFLSFWGALYMLLGKPWFWEMKYCWFEYPLQQLDSDVYWYYMIEMSYYWSLFLSISRDTRRKDFVQMTVHHVLVIVLFGFSYSANVVRIGTLIVCVHDAVDWILEGAKLANYCKYNRLSNALFVVFTVVWFIARILIYPLRLLKSAFFESKTFVHQSPIYSIYHVYLALLCLIHVLNIMWFYLILRMLYSYVIKGRLEKDSRSETEPDSESEDEGVDSSSQVNGIPRNEGAVATSGH